MILTKLVQGHLPIVGAHCCHQWGENGRTVMVGLLQTHVCLMLQACSKAEMESPTDVQSLAKAPPERWRKRSIITIFTTVTLIYTYN